MMLYGDDYDDAVMFYDNDYNGWVDGIVDDDDKNDNDILLYIPVDFEITFDPK